MRSFLIPVIACVLAAGGLGGSAATNVDTRTTATTAPTAPLAAARPANLPAWRWPLAAPHPILRPYLAPATPYSAGHRGIDVLAAETQVLAPAAGVVRFAGFVVDRPVLSIRHEDGLISSYEPVESTLVAGDAVAAGQQVGILLPGHCTRACLHFGVRLDGEYVSPLLLLGRIPRSVLLPTRPIG